MKTRQGMPSRRGAEGDRLGGVPGRPGDDAALPSRRRSASRASRAPARLERAGALEELRLQVHARAGALGERPRENVGVRCTRAGDRLARAEDVVAVELRHARGCAAGTASRTVKTVRRPGSLSTSTVPPIACVSSLTIASPSPVPTGRSRPVARVEVEALERALAVAWLEPGAGVLDLQRGPARRRPAPRRRAASAAARSRPGWRRPAGRGRRRPSPAPGRSRRRPRATRRRPPPAARSARTASSATSARSISVGWTLNPVRVHPGEVEQVADEPTEPLGLRGDRLRRVVGGDRALAQRLGVAARSRSAASSARG